MSKELQNLLNSARVWRAGRQPDSTDGTDTHIASGYPQLDAQLATRGWPTAALTEILSDQPGAGELKLVMPALARLSQREQQHDPLTQQRWLMWVAPPFIPYAPALSAAGINLNRVMVVHANKGMDALWAAEQSLRSGNCAAVLVWVATAEDKKLRRLQLAAAQGNSWGILFRPCASQNSHSPAALRLLLGSHNGKKTLRILKNRGGRPATIAADFLRP